MVENDKKCCINIDGFYVQMPPKNKKYPRANHISRFPGLQRSFSKFMQYFKVLKINN